MVFSCVACERAPEPMGRVAPDDAWQGPGTAYNQTLDGAGLDLTVKLTDAGETPPDDVPVLVDVQTPDTPGVDATTDAVADAPLTDIQQARHAAS
jgi:hypothetical protein